MPPPAARALLVIVFARPPTGVGLAACRALTFGSDMKPVASGPQTTSLDHSPPKTDVAFDELARR